VNTFRTRLGFHRDGGEGTARFSERQSMNMLQLSPVFPQEGNGRHEQGAFRSLLPSAAMIFARYFR